MKRTLLRLFYKLFPPNFIKEAYQETRMLNPGCDLVYYALYSDGCTTTGMYNGIGYFAGRGGKRHTPHLSFFPDDKPVYEWGISGLKYADTIPNEILQELRDIIFYGIGATLKHPHSFLQQYLYTKDEINKRFNSDLQPASDSKKDD